MKRRPATPLLFLRTPALTRGNDSSPTAFELTLKREACFGTCPVYSVHVNGNGAVDWSGERWVQQVGPLKSTVTPDSVQR